MQRNERKSSSLVRFLDGIEEECGGTRHNPLAAYSAIPPVVTELLRPGEFPHIDHKKKPNKQTKELRYDVEVRFTECNRN